MVRNAFLAIAGALALLLTGCGEEEAAKAPQPQELTRDATGHYCGMIVVDHKGPKGQIFLTGTPDPLWFTSVRDTLAFLLLPEEPKNIAAVYVNDMGRARWIEPEPGTWIEARSAWYVLGSSRRGGMGTAEAVPFADKAAAERFAEDYHGRVVAFADIPEDYILGDAQAPSADAHRPDKGEHE